MRNDSEYHHSGAPLWNKPDSPLQQHWGKKSNIFGRYDMPSGFPFEEIFQAQTTNHKNSETGDIL